MVGHAPGGQPESAASLKIAICGAHATGKSTLVEALASALPGHHVVEEPYHAMIDDGYVFGDPPGVEDFEAQMERSLSMMEAAGEDIIFDRAPADFLGYLAVAQRRDGGDAVVRYWNDVAAAMKELDLIVYVPIERPDRIHVPASEYPRLRSRVDDELRRLLVDDELGVAEKVLEVRGSVGDRANQVLEELARLRTSDRVVTRSERRTRGSR